MMAVRAKATTGFISGKAANSGLRVNPTARRAGATSSSALQMVGVSNALRASRSAWSGKRGMAGSSEYHRWSPAFIGKRPPAARPLLSGADHEPEWDHQRQDDERDRKTALGPAPSFPVGNPILHETTPPGHAHPFGRVHVTDQREENSTEL